MWDQIARTVRVIVWGLALLIDLWLCRLAWFFVSGIGERAAPDRDNPYATAGTVIGTSVDLLYPVAGCILVTIIAFTIDRLTRATT